MSTETTYEFSPSNLTENTELERILIQQNKGVPSLKSFAMAIDVKPQRLYAVAKTPQAGLVYDAKSYNWGALERFFARRLLPEGPATLEELVDLAWEYHEEAALTNKRRGGKAPSNAKLPRFTGSKGKEVPVRKFKIFDQACPDDTPGLNAHPVLRQVLLLTKDTNVYAIVYQTKEYTLLRAVTPEGEFQDEAVKLISNQALNSKGYGPNILTPSTVAQKYDSQVGGGDSNED